MTLIIIFLTSALLLYPAYPINSINLELTSSLVNVRKSQLSVLNEEVSLEMSQDLYYHVNVELGTPGQFLRVMVDTGSDQLWVPSVSSNSCGENRNRFDSNLSTSFVDEHYKGYIGYVSARVQGNIGKDLISLASIKGEVELLLAQKCTNIDKYGTYDGIMGLSSYRKTFNIFDLAFRNGQLVSSKFALQLNDFRGKKPRLLFNISETDFPTAYYLPNTVQIHWCVNLTGVYVQETFYPIKLGFIDTGAPYIHLPSLHFKKVYNQYFKSSCKVDKKILCSCSGRLQQYPTLSIEHAKNRFLITPQIYMTPTTQNDICELKIRSTDINKDSNAILLGGIFLKQYTVIFDKQRAQIGFVPFPVIPQQDYLTPEVLNIFVVLFCCGIFSTVILFITIMFSCRKPQQIRQALNEQMQVEMGVAQQNQKKPQNPQNSKQDVSLAA